MRYVPFALIAFSLFLAGCGGVRLAPVKGTVTLNDKPLANGTIRFETPGQRPATGKIVNGQILEVTTYKTGDGAPIGSHKVAIWANEEEASAIVANPGESKTGPNYMGGKSLIHADYNDTEKSGFKAEIRSGENVVEYKLVKKD